jgi:hypothetical protein
LHLPAALLILLSIVVIASAVRIDPAECLKQG